MKKWMVFILDLDETYDNEPMDSYGVKPMAYLIPEDHIRDANCYAVFARNDFFSGQGSECIGDLFEEWMDNNGVDFHRIGEVDLLYSERCGDYLSATLELAVV